MATFFNSCGFIDFRNEEDVREARDFVFRDNDPQAAMRPWTTALSGIGLYGRMVIFDARRHVVFFVDNDSYENSNWVLGGMTEERNEERWENVTFLPTLLTG